MSSSLKDSETTLRELRTQIAERKEKQDSLQKKLDQAEHLLQELQNRRAYLRSTKDRARTHRLIQYGAAMECRFRELAELTDPEIYTMMQQLADMPGAEEIIRHTMEKHRKENASGAVPFFEESG